MYILMGIMQFGLIFAAYLTVNNAVREGARWGSISVYDTSDNATENDETRQDGVVARIIAGRGILNMPAVGATATSNFDSGDGTWAAGVVADDCFNQSPTPYSAVKDGDFTICYTIPADLAGESDARRGYYMEVTAWYHQQIFVPLLDMFLPDDPTKSAGEQGSWIRLPGRVTVVIN